MPPLVTFSHESLLDALHAQPEPAVTVTDPDPPALDRDLLVGEIVNVQEAPDCVTVNGFPPIVSVPLRDAVLVFADTL